MLGQNQDIFPPGTAWVPHPGLQTQNAMEIKIPLFVLRLDIKSMLILDSIFISLVHLGIWTSAGLRHIHVVSPTLLLHQSEQCSIFFLNSNGVGRVVQVRECSLELGTRYASACNLELTHMHPRSWGTERQAWGHWHWADRIEYCHQVFKLKLRRSSESPDAAYFHTRFHSSLQTREIGPFNEDYCQWRIQWRYQELNALAGAFKLVWRPVRRRIQVITAITSELNLNPATYY